MSVEITIQGNKREAHPRGPIQPDPSGPRSLHPKGPRSVGQRPLPRKGHGPHGSHRAPAEIFFSASFSLPPKKLPFPALIFDGQLKTRHAPGTSFEPYPIPVLADPKKIIQALDRLRDLKTFASADAVNTTTSPQLPKYISNAFGSLDQPWKPGHLRSAYGAICCHMFKPKNVTDDIFLAQILGHKLLGPNASLSVGQSYKDFFVVEG